LSNRYVDRCGVPGSTFTSHRTGLTPDTHAAAAYPFAFPTRMIYIALNVDSVV
jgi:hypothetical protein